MEGNNIRATIFNYGMAGREGGEFPIYEQTPFEWPKNTGKVYLAVMGIVVGAEVVDEQGNTQRIISRCHYLNSPQGQTWNFEPIPGYYNESNPDGFATSNNPSTWPSLWPDKIQDSDDPGWPGKWNGYFGKDVFSADQEMYFRASDNNYDRYAYYFPDTTDLTRKGLGLILDTRVMTWSQILVQDAIYFLFKIKNDGTKPLNKVGVTIAWADFVGGDGDSEDDLSEFDILNKIAWSRDSDNRATTFGSDPVGIIAGVFLETPGNSTDRIDNDGDSPEQGLKVTEEMLVGESDESIPLGDPRRYDGIDNNGNGLIDENKTHIPFGEQVGVTYADGIGQSIDPAWLIERSRFHREENSHLVTQEMVTQSAGDIWHRWPPFPEADPIQEGKIHLIMVESDDVGLPFKDNIDNDGNGEDGSPAITQDIINSAAADTPHFRYKVNDNIILYNVVQSTLGMKYTDGIDNNDDGAIDENIDEGIDVLIDESRNNGIDDDYDWNPLSDDVGLDGLPDSGDEGENDGQPTSGARFGLPGEPNVDVTDVSETDQIGLTGSFYRTSNEWISTYTDDFIWANFMIPGNYFDPANVEPQDYNLFISSGLFPLQAGQTEPISLAVILGNGPVQDPNGEIRKQDVLNKKLNALQTYENDYQFANAPLVPTLTAVPGDNKVTLYWDDLAERSFDKYIDKIGGNGNDFEGYRIYRASDPAFEDAKVITNASGTPVFMQPIRQFDLEDGITGYDSVGYQGVHFYLGDDTGLQHSWVDSTVKNGFTYYYAITSYDFGYPFALIGPSECTISISLNPNGTIKNKSNNVVKVTPEAPVAGYLPATLGEISHIEGTTSGTIGYEIVDVNDIKDGHVYRITFEDTLIVTPNRPDTLKTKNFTLTDSTTNQIIINKSPNFSFDYEQPIIDGFKLRFRSDSRVEIDKQNSKWSSAELAPFVFEKFVLSNVKGEERPNNYIITFGDVGVATSRELIIETNPLQTFPSKPVNFTVYNTSSNIPVEFGFIETDTTGGEGKFTGKGSVKDRIVFLEPNAQDSLVKTWWFYFTNNADTSRMPMVGDTAYISIKKPFLSSDVFRFVAKAGSIDPDLAKKQLDNIKVVPNPYYASAKWEMKNPYSSGRGPRALHFTHLPQRCTIRIFTVNGELVDVIEHESQLIDGTAEWDMLTKDNLSISYGVYIYHVDAPGIGEKIGKFAVIK
jgi:hypothetical protein